MGKAARILALCLGLLLVFSIPTYAEGEARHAIALYVQDAGKSVLLDTQGAQIHPREFHTIYELTENLDLPMDKQLFAAGELDASVSLSEDDILYDAIRYALIDGTGRQLAPAAYSSLRYAYGRVVTYSPTEYLQGVLDTQGNELLPPKYPAVSITPDGGALFIDEKQGEKVLPLWRMEPDGAVHQASALVRFMSFDFEGEVLPAETDGGLYGLLSPDGEWAVEPTFSELLTVYGAPHLYIAGVVSSAGATQYGVIDTKGSWLVSPKYQSINNTAFVNPGAPMDVRLLAQTDLGEGSNYPRSSLVKVSTGEELFSLEGGYAYPSEGMIVLSGDTVQSLYNQGGELLFSSGLAGVSLSALGEDRVLLYQYEAPISKTTLSTLDGKALAGPYDTIYQAWPPNADASEKNLLIFSTIPKVSGEGENAVVNYATIRYGLMDRDGKIVLDPVYDTLWLVRPGLFQATRGDKSGLLDKAGNWLFERSAYSGLDD